MASPVVLLAWARQWLTLLPKCDHARLLPQNQLSQFDGIVVLLVMR